MRCIYSLCFVFLTLLADQATLCYELACRKVPNNLELMLGLFNCYVRDYSFLKQQQVSTYRSWQIYWTLDFSSE